VLCPNAGGHKEMKKISIAVVFCTAIIAIAVFAMDNLSLKKVPMTKVQEINTTKLVAKGNRELKKWEEKTYSEVQGGPKLTTSMVVNSLHGDIEGEATLEYVMVYLADGSATCVGIEQVTGRLGDRSGSFVLRHEGRFEAMTAKGSFTVVPGSGTGDLKGLRGEGHFETQGHTAPYTFDYYFE
jgi:hypothetical protein